MTVETFVYCYMRLAVVYNGPFVLCGTLPKFCEILTAVSTSFCSPCLPLGYVSGADETALDLSSHMPFRRISDVLSLEYSIWRQQQASRMLQVPDYLFTFS